MGWGCLYFWKTGKDWMWRLLKIKILSELLVEKDSQTTQQGADVDVTVAALTCK